LKRDYFDSLIIFLSVFDEILSLGLTDVILGVVVFNFPMDFLRFLGVIDI
jgi:hypothetical protein